jgi:hypothetical protein
MNLNNFSLQQAKLINTVNIDKILMLFGNPDIFDANFYSRFYIGKSVSKLYAVAHYLMYGRYDLRNPSASFSTKGYYKNYSDVKDSGEMAGLHYAAYRYTEPRVAIPVDTLYPNSIVLDVSDEQKSGVKSKIAIIIHAFYSDYNEIFALLLSFYDFEFTLFITSPYQTVVDDLVERLKKHNVSCTIKIAITLNRGRNFAPFLVSFGKELRDYDVIGHVHTKKSMHHGKPRYDWGLSSITGVLGSPEYVSFVINELTVKDKYGIVSAEVYQDAIPYYGYHWLRNFEIGNQLAEQLGLAAIEQKFANYPIGGMFWARKESLAKILARDWSYEDFPEEAGQLDGTVQHAIERLLGIACEQAEFKLLKWEVEKGIFNDNPLPLATYYEKEVKFQATLNAIAAANVVSFDIFDTLLYRNVVDPNDVRDNLESICPEYRSLRAKAETIARDNLLPKTDVRLIDIAKHLAKLLEKTPYDAITLLKQEFKYDMLSMRRRNPIIDLVKHAKNLGKRIIYVSDMYYETPEIMEILKHLDIPMPDKLYVSSEVGLRKDNGFMWKYVREKETGFIIHFGDNMVSDVQLVRDYVHVGLEAYYVPSIQDKARLMGIIQKHPSNNEWSIVCPILERIGSEAFFG